MTHPCLLFGWLVPAVLAFALWWYYEGHNFYDDPEMLFPSIVLSLVPVVNVLVIASHLLLIYDHIRATGGTRGMGIFPDL